MPMKRKYSSQNTQANYDAVFKKSRRVSRTYYPMPSRYAMAPRKMELKYDDGISSAGLAAGSYIYPMTNIAAGTDASNRIGRHIAYHDWLINLNITYNALNTSCRILLIYDKQTNGAVPGVTTVLNGTDVYALTNPDTRDRFTIIWDKSFTNPNGAASTAEVISVNNKFSLRGKKAEFVGVTNGIADINAGCLFMIVLCNNGIGFSERNRIQFYDN